MRTNTLVFNTAGTKVNENGSMQALSHAALWVDNSLTSTSTVPEPSTYVLIAAGLAGLGFAARPRRTPS